MACDIQLGTANGEASDLLGQVQKLIQNTLLRRFFHVLAFLPAVVLFIFSIQISADQHEKDQMRHVGDHARLAAANLDTRFGQILELTSFCATSPELIERVDLEVVADTCGRYASRIGAWVVIVEVGAIHRQVLNTRSDAFSSSLPSYPREDERETLLVLEERSRNTGEPHFADVFQGILLSERIVSAGQYVHLADGRDAMIYVGIAARSLSEELASLATQHSPVFGLVDPTRRIVARSVDIERAMFADAPEWLAEFIDNGIAGASLGMPGPDVLGGTWNAGYTPLKNAQGWMVVALEPTSEETFVWAPWSTSTAFTLLGFLFTSYLLWGLSLLEKGLQREVMAERAKNIAIGQNQDKSRLLASLAHDIRSPLISLIGSLEMIDGRERASSDKVQLARNSAESLLQLADDILELSFLGSGQMSFHPSPVDLRQLATALHDQIKRLAERKGLVIRLELDPDLPLVVEVDRLRLQQVLTNLLTNAVKYTERGEVTLQFRVEDRSADHVTLDIAVLDTGIGLAQEDIPRILREFGRLDRPAVRNEAGTGLGLAIVQRLLTAMGSMLEVESVPGQGSRFHFRINLPILPADAWLNEAQQLADYVILYAEDEPVIRQLTVQRLQEAGAQVVSATDGEHALRLLSDVAPDLLLIDLQMPGLDGVGLIRRLHKSSPEIHYPIFVLTSHISGPQAAEARAAGADAVFTKPIQVAALAAALRARYGNCGKSTANLAGPQEFEEPLLDMAVTQDISTFRDPNKASVLIAQFEESTKADFFAIASAIDAQDMSKTVKIAHRAQGLCLVIGAKRVACLLKSIEMAAAAPTDTAAMADFVAELDNALASTITALRMKFTYDDTVP